ncbi:MAG: hypothetical protein ACI4HQ_08975 [Acetatifactor sp.]
MGQDIFVGVLCVIALAAGVWAWWVDNRGTDEREGVKESEEYTNEKN